MSALDEVAAAIHALGDQIEEALTAARAVDSEIDDARGTAASLGANATVEGLTQLSSQIETLSQMLGQAGETAKEALGTAQQIAEST